MAEKPRESLNDALSSYLADHATRPPGAEPIYDREGRSTGPVTDLGAAYQAIVETFQPARPVEGTAAPTPPQPATGSGKDHLVQAYDRLIEHEATKPRGFLGPVPPGWRRFVLPAIAAAALAGMVYLWVARPAWLYPRFEPLPPPATQVAAEQLLIATLIMVQQFEADSGRLPRELNELEADMRSVSMVVTGGGGYQLMAGVGNRAISLRVMPGVDPMIEGGAR